MPSVFLQSYLYSARGQVLIKLIPAAPRDEPPYPLPAPGVFRRALDGRKSLSRYALKVFEPLGLR